MGSFIEDTNKFIKDTNKKWYKLVGKVIPVDRLRAEAQEKIAKEKKLKLKKEQEKLKLKPTVIPKKIKTKPIGKNYPEGKKGKPYVKKAGSGKVKNRNIGGVIGGGLNSQDVVGYLYDYKS